MRTAHWNTRQAMLASVLRAHGAEHHEFRVDLGLGRFWWQDAAGKPSVVAETKVLGSWALSNRSVLAGWMNRSLPPSAVTAKIEGVAEGGVLTSEAEVWDWALSIAEGAKADFVYRAPNAQSWIFLGLWSVRSAGPNDAPFSPGPPWEHVRRVLSELGEPRDAGERRTLMRNYGRTFVNDHAARGTAWERPLRSIGEDLIALADAPNDAALDRGLALVVARVP